MLNISQTFKNGFGSNTTHAYPIVIINKDADNEIRLSRKKGVFDGLYYEDRFLSVSPISERIDISSRRFQVSQISVNVSNFSIEGVRFTQKFANENFINSTVDIYYANDACKTLDECALIYKGFVRNYNADDKSAKFLVEDESQYVLDVKTLPKARTSNPADESIAASRDVVIPMTYGRVDKAPVVFSRSANLGFISRILPDDLIGSDAVNIYGYRTDEPLLIKRGDDYFRIPKTFQDLPSGFEISGYDYSNFNGTEQYEIDESTNQIIIEKKVSDATYSFGVPQNVQARDQMQIRTDRQASGISLPDITSPLEFGDGTAVQYQQFDIDKSIDTPDFYFPVPTDQILAGFYRNLKIVGAQFANWNIGNPSVQFGWEIGYSNDMHMRQYCTSLSSVNVGDVPAMDGCFLPQASDMAQHIKYFLGEDIFENGDENPGSFISESRIRGWVWGIGGNEERAYANTGEWQGTQIQECKMTGTNSGATGELPSSGRWLDSNEGGGFNDRDYNYCQAAIDDPSFQDWGDSQNIGHSMPITPLWGDGHFVNHGTIIDSTQSNVGYFKSSLGSMLLGLWVWHSSDSSTWDINNKDAYTIIPLDADLKGEGNNVWREDTTQEFGGMGGYHNYFIDLGQATWVGDTPKTLRKLMWGRKITLLEADDLYTQTGTFIPEGSAIYCKYPVLSQAVIRTTANYATDGSDRDYYCDVKYSYQSLDESANLYYQDGDSYQLNYQRLDAQRIAPDNGGYQFVPFRHDYDGDNFYPIIFKHMSESRGGNYFWSPINCWKTELSVPDTGRDAYYGGDWAVVEDINGTRKEVKIDITYNSIDGNDIVAGGVHQTVEGELEIEMYREDGQSFSSSQDQFVCELSAFKDNNNDILEFDLNSIPVSTEVDSELGANVISKIRTGHQNFATSVLEDENSPFYQDYINYQNEGTIFATPDTVECDEPPAIVSESTVPVDNHNPTHILMIADNDDLVDDWKQNPNSINNLSLHFRFSQSGGQKTAYIRGFVRDFRLKQLCILSNASQQEFYANIWGRIDIDDGDGYGRYTGASMLSQTDEGELVPNLTESQLLEKPSDILMHIIERELGYNNGDLASSFDLNSVDVARNNHDGWRYAFSLNDEVKAKSFMQDFCKETKLIPRFRYDGTFSFINILKQYDEENLIIDSKDVINFKYSKTPLNDIVLKCRVKYNYDVGNNNYEAATNIDGDGAVPKNLDKLMDIYGIKSTDDAYLEVESKFIRDENTAIELRNYLLEWYKNQHNVIECDLFPKYMELECGDVVRFEELIQNISMFGDDYTEGFRLHGTYQDGGQWVYPYFMVTEVKKSLDKISVKLVQLHKSESFNVNNTELLSEDPSTSVPAPEFNEVVEESESVELSFGDVNFDGQINVLDVVAMVQAVVNAPFEGLQFIAADINQDTYVDVLDIVQIVSSVVNGQDLGTITVEG